ncbi:MAG TPA: hypothetical protein PLD88_10370, partial [Candidatus Berkiella sp.]|nr:hypothetical protein [Candidatus Berkiella sp.]
MPRKNHNIANLPLEEIIKTAGSRARIAASSGYPLNEEKLLASASVFAEHAQAYVDAYKRSHTLNFGKKNIEDIIKKRAYTCARAQSNRAMVTNDKTLMEKAKKLF